MAFLSANFSICEKVLREADGVMSLIRLVDFFQVKVVATVPVEQQQVQMFCAGVIRITQEDDSPHTASMTIVRPNGEEKENPLFTDQVIPPSKIPDQPRTFWVVVQLGISPTQYGAHDVVIKFDGREAARMQIILKELSSDTPVSNLPPELHPRLQ